MKKNILLSLAVFLSLITLSQEAKAAGTLIISRSEYLPALTPAEWTVHTGPFPSVADLKSLVVGKFANSDHAGTPGTLRDITVANLVIRMGPADRRVLNAGTLAEINGKLAQGHMAHIEVDVRPGAMIHARHPHAGDPAPHDFPRP